jgi:hypothetical protein
MYKVDLNVGFLNPSGAPLKFKGGTIGLKKLANILSEPFVYASSISVSSLILNWTPVTHATKYIVQRATTPEFDQDLVVLFNGSGSSVNDIHLYPGKRYYYRVQAIDEVSGLLSSSYGVTDALTSDTVITSGTWRAVNSGDIASFPQMSLGDAIIDGSNIDREIYIAPGTGPSLGPGKKIWIRGGKYEICQFDNLNVIGTNVNRVIISTYGGCPVITKRGFRLFGGNWIRFTGKYDSTLNIGQSHLRGHDADYAWRHRTYGFIWDNEWLDQGDSAPSGIVIDRGGQNYEIDYFEGRGGGFAPFFIRDDNGGTLDYTNIYIHDCLTYCSNGEAVYIGATAGVNGSRRIKSLKFTNTTLIYPGNDGIQLNNVADNCIVENNVCIGAGANWRDSFEYDQDNGQSIGVVKGGLKFRKNLAWGSGEKHWNFFYVGPTPEEEDGTSIDVDDNLFFGTKGPLFMYMANTGAAMNNTPLNIRRNYFGRANFIYDQVFKSANKGTNRQWIIRNDISNNAITYQDNKFDGQGGKTSFLEPNHGTGNTIVNTNNIQATLPDVQFQKFLGFGSTFNYDNVEIWASVIGSQGGWANDGTSFKGDPITYAVGKYVIHKDFWYKSKAAGNTGIEPNVHPQWTTYWNQVYWDKTTGLPVESPIDRTNFSPLPPLDVRLVNNNSIYQQTGIGLLDNPAPVINSNLLANTIDNGDNTFTVKFGRNRAQLTQNPVIPCIGSSTFFGLQATTTANSALGRVATWLGNNTTNSMLLNLGVSSTDTRYGSADGTFAQVTPHKNITAALAVNPTAILVGYPTNDINAGLTPQQFCDNLVAIFNLAKSKGVPCFIGSPQPRTGFNATDQQKLADAAVLIKAAIPDEFYIDVFDATRDQTAPTAAVILPLYSFGDDVHYNDLGHAFLADAYIAKLDAYFQNQSNQGYEIESSINPDLGFTVLATEPSATVVSKILDRPDQFTHYYRVRAKISTGVYTQYSNVVSMYQPIKVGTLAQTIQLDFSPDTNVTSGSGWNTLLGSGGGISAGTSFATIKDSLDATISGVTLTVTKAFTGALTGGTNTFSGYPSFATQDSWNIVNSATIPAELTVNGLSQANVYNAEIVSSRSTSSTWMSGFYLTGGKTGGSRVANPDGSANNLVKININGVVPDVSNNITVDVRALASAYLNTLILKKYNAVANPAPQSFSTIQVVGVVTQTWNIVEKLPYDYSTNLNATYPLIVYFVGLGQVGTNQALLLSEGPNKYIGDGTWNGRIQTDTTWHDPIVISVQPSTQWPHYTLQLDALDKILARYAGRVDLDKVHLTGISMGGWMTSGIVMNSQTHADKIASIVNVQGVKPSDWAASPYTAMGNFKRGRWLGFEQSNDGRDIPVIANTINLANPGETPAAAIFEVTNFGAHDHCCFNEWFDPSRKAYGNLDGRDESIYQWMMRRQRALS